MDKKLIKAITNVLKDSSADIEAHDNLLHEMADHGVYLNEDYKQVKASRIQ